MRSAGTYRLMSSGRPVARGMGQVDEGIPPLQPGYVRTIESGVVVDTPIGPHGTSQIVDTPDTSPSGAGTGVPPGATAGAGGGSGSTAGAAGDGGFVLFPGPGSGTGLGPFPNIFGVKLPSINLPNLPIACTTILGSNSFAQAVCPYAFWILLGGAVFAVVSLTAPPSRRRR